MALPIFNTKSPTIKRILKEATELSSHPDPTLHAAPLDSNLFEWHFTMQGPPSTPYSQGTYHGRIILPSTYPLRPPSFRFLTPSGRFEVNREICLSISGHHEETWQPAWGIRTALWALRAFMEGDAKGQVGGMEMPEKERKRLAEESRGWKCYGCGGRTNERILKEEGGEGSGDSKFQEVVPKELKFGFRDEMGKKPDEQAESPDPQHIPALHTDSIPEIASKVTQTIPATTSTTSASPPTTTSTTSASPPTNTSIASRAYVPRPVPDPPRRLQSDGVPAWVDKVITGLLAALAVMVIKKIMV